MSAKPYQLSNWSRQPLFNAVLLLIGLSSSLCAQIGTINNDTWWTDDNGALITASLGGHITLVGDTYYWVGNDQQTTVNGNDIHLYSSKTLGSDSWKHEGKLVEYEAAGATNCTLLRSPATGNFVIVGKSGLQFWESDQVTGPYTLVNSLRKGEVGNRPDYKIGGMSTFQDGDDAYVITSRRYLGEENNNR